MVSISPRYIKQFIRNVHGIPNEPAELLNSHSRSPTYLFTKQLIRSASFLPTTVNETEVNVILASLRAPESMYQEPQREHQFV